MTAAEQLAELWRQHPADMLLRQLQCALDGHWPAHHPVCRVCGQTQPDTEAAT